MRRSYCFLFLLCVTKLLTSDIALHSCAAILVPLHLASAADMAGRHMECFFPSKKSECFALRVPVCAPVVLRLTGNFCMEHSFAFAFLAQQAVLT